VKKQKYPKGLVLTLERVYSRLAILFFSIIFFIISIMLLVGQPLTNPSLIVYFGFGFFSLSFIGFGFLIGDFLAYYGLKSYGWFRKRWNVYKWYYWLIVLGVILSVLVLIAYENLDKNTFWSLIIGIFGPAILAAIGWILVTRIFKKKLFNKKSQ